MEQEWYKDMNIYIVIFIIIVIVMWQSKKAELFSDFKQNEIVETESSRLSARELYFEKTKNQQNIRKITPTTKDYKGIVKPFSTDLQLTDLTDMLDTTLPSSSFKKIGRVSNEKDSYQLYSRILLESVTKEYSYYILYNNKQVYLNIKTPLENNDIIHVPGELNSLYKVIIE